MAKPAAFASARPASAPARPHTLASATPMEVERRGDRLEDGIAPERRPHPGPDQRVVVQAFGDRGDRERAEKQPLVRVRSQEARDEGRECEAAGEEQDRAECGGGGA
jgi:hypothetical protein